MSPSPPSAFWPVTSARSPSVTRPPAVGFLGLLLVGYVVGGRVGVVRRLLLASPPGRRSGRPYPPWPLLAALAAILAGVGAGSGPLVKEVRDLSRSPPAGTSLRSCRSGMVQLPGGGSRRVELASPRSEDRAPGLGRQPGRRDGRRRDGRPSKAPGPAAGDERDCKRAAEISGRVGSQRDRTLGRDHPRGRRSSTGRCSSGTVRNDLGVKLTDAEVVVASGEAAEELGSLRPGRSTRFELAVSPSSNPWPQAFGAPVPISPTQFLRWSRDGAPRRASALGAAGPRSAQSMPRSSTTAAGQKDAAAKRQVEMALGDLAASYSTQQGGAPVFVAMAAHKLFPLDVGSREPPAVTDVIVVPLTGHQSQHVTLSDVPGELVGSTGVTGETEYAITTGSLTLNAGGILRLPVPSSRHAVARARPRPRVRPQVRRTGHLLSP